MAPMRISIRRAFLASRAAILALLAFAFAPPVARSQPVTVTIETTLMTAPGQIRQFAFDGDANTFFASAKPPTPSDHFTFVFDNAVKAKAIAVITGRTDGSDAMDAGKLE